MCIRDSTPHIGESLMIAIWDTAVTSGPVAEWTSGVDAGGYLLEEAPELLQGGHEYAIGMYFDHNLDGTCTPPPDDHGWVLNTPPINQDTTINYDHNVNFASGVCNLFP